jgi:H+/Cl- antiporter ClcA
MNMLEQFPFSMISWVQPKNVFFAAGVFNMIFILVVMVFLFIKQVKNKWLWLPVIFAGFTEASAQWVDDGPWSFTLLAVKYPSVWIDAAAGQDPWSIVISLPLGAAVVLLLVLTATPEPEELAIPTLPQNGMPRRTQVQPRQRPRPQPTKVGK